MKILFFSALIVSATAYWARTSLKLTKFFISAPSTSILRNRVENKINFEIFQSVNRYTHIQQNIKKKLLNSFTSLASWSLNQRSIFKRLITRCIARTSSLLPTSFLRKFLVSILMTILITFSGVASTADTFNPPAPSAEFQKTRQNSFSNSGLELSSWLPENIPNWILSPNDRGFLEKSAVCDPNQLMSEEDIYEIEEMIKGLWDDAQVGVLVINKINLSVRTDGASSIDTARDFSRIVFDNWGLGAKSFKNGILIFLSVEDRSVYITASETNSKFRLIDSTTKDLLHETKPMLDNAEYGRAVKACLNALKSRLKPDVASFWKIATIGGILTYAGARSSRTLYKNFIDRSAKSKLDEILLETIILAVDKSYESTNCPLCLEGFTTNGSGDGSLLLYNATVPVDGNSSLARLSKHSGIGISEPVFNSPPSSPILGVLELLANKAASREAVMLTCGHRFCQACLKAYTSKLSFNKCPLCIDFADAEDNSRTSSSTSPTTSTAAFFPFDSGDGLLASPETPKQTAPLPLTNYLTSREYRLRLRSFRNRYGNTPAPDSDFFRDLSNARSLEDLEQARRSHLKLSSLDRRLEEARAVHATYVQELESQYKANDANSDGQQRRAA